MASFHWTYEFKIDLKTTVDNPKTRQEDNVTWSINQFPTPLWSMIYPKDTIPTSLPLLASAFGQPLPKTDTRGHVIVDVDPIDDNWVNLTFHLHQLQPHIVCIRTPFCVK
jgi:hypothetical protein